MKRIMYTIICLVMLISLVCCNSRQDHTVRLSSGTYYAVGDYEKFLTPYLYIDTSNGTFRYGGGAVVSYAEYGTYTVQDRILVAVCQNQSQTYFFEIKDNQTLELIFDGGREKYVFSEELK